MLREVSYYAAYASVEAPGAYAREHWELSAAEKRALLPTLKVWVPLRSSVDKLTLPVSRLQTEGNELFVGGDYAGASEKYSVAMGYVEELLLPLPTGEGADLRALRPALLLNLSAAACQQGDYPAAVEHATRAFEAARAGGDILDSATAVSTRAKALFRRGAAHLARGRDLDQAAADLAAAAALAPGDAAIATAQRRAADAQQAAAPAARDLLRRMMAP